MNDTRLTELTTKMSGLVAEVHNSPILPKKERQKLARKVFDVLGDCDCELRFSTFRPEVPAETQKLYFQLMEFFTKK